VQVVVPREKVQFSGLVLALDWATDRDAVANAAEVGEVGAVGALHAPRRMEAKAMAVARDLMGDSLAVKSVKYSDFTGGKPYAFEQPDLNWHLGWSRLEATERVRVVSSTVTRYEFTTSGRYRWREGTGNCLCPDPRQKRPDVVNWYLPTMHL
jgi:hypothetical protein